MAGLERTATADQVHPGEAAVAPPLLDDSQQPAVLLKRPVPDGAQTKNKGQNFEMSVILKDPKVDLENPFQS